jgi:DNA gyrase subunit B
MAFVPRKYDTGIIEQMALSGALDPQLDASTRQQALELAAMRLAAGDEDARWTASLREDGSVRFDRLWRGVTDVHEIEAKFLDSAEARKLHKLASEQAEAYVHPSRLTRVSAEAAEAEPVEETEGEETEMVVASGEGAISRPTQLLDQVLAAGRKGMSISRYKGLGEMNAEQLWETTLDPEARVLLQVKVEDADVTDEIFTRLMGDVVEPRREFIQDNALNVANLDV